MEERTEKYDGDIAIKSPFLERLDNFWYHYKWHTLVALFLIFVFCVCAFQMCSKESYDTYIMYAGHKSISRTSEDGDIPEYNTFVSSFKRVCEDFDGNGEISLSFSNLYVMSEEVKQKIEAELGAGVEVNESLLSTDRSTLVDRLMYSEYYVCLLSKEVYDEYRVISDVEMFLPLGEYTEDGVSYEWENDNAIYLHSTAFAELPGICDLPEDTLICLRMKSAISSAFGGEQNEEMFARSEEVIRAMLSGK